MPSADYYKKDPEKYKAEASGWYYANTDKAKATCRAYAAKHRAEAIRRTKAWQKANPKKKSEMSVAYRRKKNGFSRDKFNEIMHLQNGRCAICITALTTGLGGTAASADHDHTTKQPRGILCKRCNLMLGLVKDSQETLHRAAAYLAKYQPSMLKQTA